MRAPASARYTHLIFKYSFLFEKGEPKPPNWLSHSTSVTGRTIQRYPVAALLRQNT